MFRRLAQIFLVLSGAVAAADIATTLPDGTTGRLADLGAWWAWLHIDSLQLLQPAVQRHLAPWLWDFGIQPLLLQPLSLELLALAALCWIVRRRPETDGRPTRTGRPEPD